MTPEELARVKSLHSQALLLPERERDDFLREQLPASPGLLETVRRLLAWHSEAGEFLQTPPASRMLDPLMRDLQTCRIGPYELIRELGHGGSSTVYLAQRADGLFERHVAIKVLSRLAHSGEVFRRFQREIQILARVEHPYIVRLLEAGTTGETLSYIVTEYIDGVHIDRFAANLDVEGRLRLFLRVCEAVSAAHRALIVHRDLKPSNILVTPDGIPKVLDFGIAVLVDRDSRLTQGGLERLTVRYASPEQLRGEKLITTASDVYSLGVILYELIAGRVPYDFPEREMAERIASSDPPPLSAAPRELYAIARKALSADPRRRYESVDRLRDDIVRRLDGRPVEAQGNGALYRLRKYARRHWLLIAIPSLAMLLLGSLSIVLVISLREARRQSERVRQIVFQSLPSLMFDAEHWRTVRMRKAVESARLPYLDALAAEYPNDAALRAEPFRTRRALAAVEGLPFILNLGDTAEARSLFESAVQLGDRLIERGTAPAGFRRDLALTHLELGTVLLETDDIEAAHRQFALAGRLGGGLRAGL